MSKKVKRRKKGMRNPVAKFMNTVSKPKVERDKSKYTRKRKHKGGEKND